MFSTPLTMFNVPRIGVHSQLKKRVIELENTVKQLQDENLRLELRNEKLYQEFDVHPWGLYIFFLLLTVTIVATAFIIHLWRDWVYCLFHLTFYPHSPKL